MREYFPKRTVFAMFVGWTLAVPVLWFAADRGAEGWGLILLGVPFMFIGSLFDREGFYGPREDPPRDGPPPN